MITIINNNCAATSAFYAGFGARSRTGRCATASHGRQYAGDGEKTDETVLSSCDHPTAETVCERVREVLPAVSLGTVYRVLKGLAAEGKVREIAVPDAPARFDKTTGTHAHFVCGKCGRVEDVDVDAAEIVKAACRGCGDTEITEAEIIFRGICRDCKEEKR